MRAVCGWFEWRGGVWRRGDVDNSRHFFREFSNAKSLFRRGGCGYGQCDAGGAYFGRRSDARAAAEPWRINFGRRDDGSARRTVAGAERVAAELDDSNEL